MGFFDDTDTADAGVDKYGRYQFDVDGKGVRPYTRATTIARVLEDEYHLTQWKLRTVAHGIGLREDLAQRAAVTPVSDKRNYKEILTEADSAASSAFKRNVGTAFHQFRAMVADPEYDQSTAPAKLRTAYANYESELARLGIEDLLHLRETALADVRTGVAGTTDGFAKLADGRIVILDTKTGGVDYPHSFAIQLAIYANATHMFVRDQGEMRWVPMTQVEKLYGLVAHVDVETGSVDIYSIDLLAGAQAYTQALYVRNWRKRKDLLLPFHGASIPQDSVSAPTPAVAVFDTVNPLQEVGGAGVPSEPVTAPVDPLTDAPPSNVVPMVRPVATDEDEARAKAAITPAPTGGSELVDALQARYKTKAELQTAAKSMGIADVARTRKNLAVDMVTHDNWPEHAERLLADPEPQPNSVAHAQAALDRRKTVGGAGEVVAQTGVVTDDVGTIGANPFADDVPEPEPEAVQETAEETLIRKVSSATSTQDLKDLWDEANAVGVGWTARLAATADIVLKNINKGE